MFQLKSHRSNPFVEKRVERAPVNKELTNIKSEVAAEIVEKLQLSGVVEPSQLVELGPLFRVSCLNSG